MKKYKILVFTYANTNSHEGCSFQRLLDITNPSKEEYCKIHGYDFICKTDLTHNHKNDIGWEKIKIINEYIDQYDYIFYVEADAIIMNQTIKIENLIDENYDIFVSINKRVPEERYEINCGTLLVKCSSWSKQFMLDLYSKKHIKHHDYPDNWAEQIALIKELVNSPETRKHFKLMHLRYFNSFYRPDFPDDTFKMGDFILHAVGMPNSMRETLLDECKNKIIKMPSSGLQTPCI